MKWLTVDLTEEEARILVQIAMAMYETSAKKKLRPVIKEMEKVLEDASAE